MLGRSAFGIPETNYKTDYHEKLLPFLASGERFGFQSADGKHELQGIRFLHPYQKGVVVIVSGFSQSWLQYGELFYDLYHQGYSILSYDHCGQGVSPHLVRANSQIGHAEHFIDYSRDLNVFMEKIVRPLHPDAKGIFIIAHSMGAAIAFQYLELHSGAPPCEGIVLSAPMLEINTHPYPERIAHLIVGTLRTLGLGAHYAIGMHDYNPQEPFNNNHLTHSHERWEMDRETKMSHPEAIIGGPSNAWVDTSLSETLKIRSKEPLLTIRTLILEAGDDQLVINQAEKEASLNISGCRLVKFPQSRHEILMEKDTIRGKALSEIMHFLKPPSRSNQG
jgi:lysophospholipase